MSINLSNLIEIIFYRKEIFILKLIKKNNYEILEEKLEELLESKEMIETKDNLIKKRYLIRKIVDYTEFTDEYIFGLPCFSVGLTVEGEIFLDKLIKLQYLVISLLICSIFLLIKNIIVKIFI